MSGIHLIHLSLSAKWKRPNKASHLRIIALVAKIHLWIATSGRKNTLPVIIAAASAPRQISATSLFIFSVSSHFSSSFVFASPSRPPSSFDANARSSSCAYRTNTRENKFQKHVRKCHKILIFHHSFWCDDFINGVLNL